MKNTSHNSRVIRASVEKIYQALTDPQALASWQAPDDMTAKVHDFDGREGGGYTMSLFYAETDEVSKGKTKGKEDRFSARFVKLDPPHQIIQAVRFDTDNPAFEGEMIMEVTLEALGEDTKVSFSFRDIPPGIRPEDNEAGTASSLEKLAAYVE
ncbi:SRPBCC family protein [Chitinophaga pinensis]|uniref:Activator of Hsp90 ATPase 1 family protein n=1 Tax=Chitinophaga pinensis (strain ATCC 43595 / DSM 2588 / LMG 13176 / NBRC 15968 / NCIMB 11800 / UQM 2034) TaxID=485918 RepID=A0A979GY88_CHIPD|nr:SRPBCC family protein [Chitinophaga pinensis]ACU63049.1 Activator of Hsp90 ATPase 1 family protein [Chitinophaga pinensis DSM 2588]